MQNRPLTRLYLPSDTCKRFQEYLQEKETQRQHRQQQQQMESKEVSATTDTGATATASVVTRRMTRRSVAGNVKILISATSPFIGSRAALWDGSRCLLLGEWRADASFTFSIYQNRVLYDARVLIKRKLFPQSKLVVYWESSIPSSQNLEAI